MEYVSSKVQVKRASPVLALSELGVFKKVN